MGLDAHTIIMLCTDHTENWRRHGRTPGGIAGFVYERAEKETSISLKCSLDRQIPNRMILKRVRFLKSNAEYDTIRRSRHYLKTGGCKNEFGRQTENNNF